MQQLSQKLDSLVQPIVRLHPYIIHCLWANIFAPPPRWLCREPKPRWPREYTYISGALGVPQATLYTNLLCLWRAQEGPYTHFRCLGCAPGQTLHKFPVSLASPGKDPTHISGALVVPQASLYTNLR